MAMLRFKTALTNMENAFQQLFGLDRVTYFITTNPNYKIVGVIMCLNKRCPWCGEIIKGRFFQRGHYHCTHCGNYSKIYRSGWIYGLGAVFGLGVIILMKYVFSIYSLILFWTIYSITCIALPLEMASKHFVPRKKSNVKITVMKKIPLIKRRLLFSEKKLFPICFIDDNNNPISHTLCISVEDVKFISSNNLCANIKFIPLSDFNADFHKGTKFYLFHDGEKVGCGVLSSNVE